MSPWLTCRNPNPHAQFRLFCFPYAGGGASIFHAWPNHVPLSIEIYLIHLPGREKRWNETPFTRLAPLVQALAQILSPHLNLPFAFFGHSMGALISFELVRYFRQQNGLTPVHLFVSAYRAPHLPDRHPRISHLDDSAFIKELRSLNGTPEEVLQHSELMHLMLPLLRADFALCETYAYSADLPLDCPISAFGGLEDSEVHKTELEGWRDQTNSSFMLRMFPGDHFFLHQSRAPVLQAIAQDMALHSTRLC